jgi:predicted regulator of amino acid metabolism with ACT domain
VCARSGQPILLEEAKQAILRFISDNDPTIEDIQRVSEDLTAVQSIEQLEKVLYENANCTPLMAWPRDRALAESPGVKNTIVLCGVSVASKRLASIRNIGLLRWQLDRVTDTQQRVLVPAVEKYVKDPTKENWENVKMWLSTVQGLVKVATRSALAVDGINDKEMVDLVDSIFAVLSHRSSMISKILQEPSKTQEEMTQWLKSYRVLVNQLVRYLDQLQSHLRAKFE